MGMFNTLLKQNILNALGYKVIIPGDNWGPWQEKIWQNVLSKYSIAHGGHGEGHGIRIMLKRGSRGPLDLSEAQLNSTTRNSKRYRYNSDNTIRDLVSFSNNGLMSVIKLQQTPLLPKLKVLSSQEDKEWNSIYGYEGSEDHKALLAALEELKKEAANKKKPVAKKTYKVKASVTPNKTTQQKVLSFELPEGMTQEQHNDRLKRVGFETVKLLNTYLKNRGLNLTNYVDDDTYYSIVGKPQLPVLPIVAETKPWSQREWESYHPNEDDPLAKFYNSDIYKNIYNNNERLP